MRENVTEHDKDESTGFFDLLSWENEHLLLWTIPETGGASEYISAMFEEIYERFSGRTRGVLLVDVRRGEVPGAASRANIVAGVNRLSDNLSAVAIVVGSSHPTADRPSVTIHDDGHRCPVPHVHLDRRCIGVAHEAERARLNPLSVISGSLLDPRVPVRLHITAVSSVRIYGGRCPVNRFAS